MTPDEARLQALEKKIEYLQRQVRELEMALTTARQTQDGIFSK